MFVARMNSSFLAESEHNMYLTAELGTILDWCDLETNITLKPYASYTSSLIPASSVSSASASAASPTCTGQVVDADTAARLAKRQLVSGAPANSNISQACLDYSLEYEVPTGSLVIASGDSTCANITAGICLPGACELAQVTLEETTCDLLAAGLTVAGDSVSLVQLLYWNPTIIGTCDSLQVDQYVCISPPGGSWTPAVANITSTVGDGGGVTATFVSGATTGTPTNGIATPTPIQTGMTTSCDVFYAVRSGDSCDSVTTEYNIALADFYAWNPAVGTDCLSLELGVYVCVDTLESSSSSASATLTTASNTFSTPSPVQTGIPSNCDEFHLVASGDTCQVVADDYDITLAQLYAWNPAVGSSCEDLELDTYICVAVAIIVSTPSPVQTGISSTCDEFHLVVSGDTCGDLASASGISLAQFYEWNPAVGSECQDLELNTYVCMLVDGVTATATVTLVTTPSPVQTGMASDCDAFYYVTSGDGCAAIASKEDIATASFYAWNPAVGTDCADLYLDYYVCVGVETTAVAARSALPTTEADLGAAESKETRSMPLPLITPAPRWPGRLA